MDFHFWDDAVVDEQKFAVQETSDEESQSSLRSSPQSPAKRPLEEPEPSPVVWVERIRSVVDLAALEKHVEPWKLVTGCSGTGAASLSLQVECAVAFKRERKRTNCIELQDILSSPKASQRLLKHTTEKCGLLYHARDSVA